MRYRELISEAKVVIPSSFAPILTSVTSTDMAALCAKEDYRGIIHDNKVYVSRAYSWTHRAMADELGIDHDDWGILYFTTNERNDDEQQFDDDGWVDGATPIYDHPKGFIVFGIFTDAERDSAGFQLLVRGAVRPREKALAESAVPLTEAIDSVFVDVESEYFNGTLEVFRNPSRGTFMKQRQIHQHARAFLNTKKQDIFVWFEAALHHDIDHADIDGEVWVAWDEPIKGKCSLEYYSESFDDIDEEDFHDEVEKRILAVKPFARLLQGFIPSFRVR